MKLLYKKLPSGEGVLEEVNPYTQLLKARPWQQLLKAKIVEFEETKKTYHTDSILEKGKEYDISEFEINQHISGFEMGSPTTLSLIKPTISQEPDWDWYGWLCARIPELKTKANEFWIRQCMDSLVKPPVSHEPSSYDLIEACKYGYNYHQTTQFPEYSFEDNCLNNFLQKISNTSTAKYISQETALKMLEALKIAQSDVDLVKAFSQGEAKSILTKTTKRLMSMISKAEEELNTKDK